ncbi:MAG: hypothetical protein KKD39_00340 [Candidatus Altiarchaeota archaeon]|nr:hypothetical protein [Candidatus Altiarchaeota archaeon]
MVGRLVLQMKHWGKSIEYFIDFIFVAVTYAFLLSIFQPSLLLSDTFITGGDTGSHMYPAWYMRQYLLPHLKLFGWSMDWYGGFPIFEYYFPLPFAVAALMSYVISFNISFKLVTAFGVFLLPIASYAYMRLVGFKHPAPALACVFSLCLLFNEEYSIWGGNIKSTLAGQFTFTWGQALAVLFMGLVYSFVESKKHFLKSAIVLAAIPICHIYTLIWAVSSSMPIVISRAKKDFIAKANRLWAVYICGFLLSAFWSMNTVAKLGWSTAFGAWRSQSIWEVVPNILLPFYPLAIAAVFYFLYKPSRKLGYLLSITISPILFFAFIKLSSTEHLLDVRFMPFAYLGILYLSAYVLSKIIRSFRGVWISSIIVLLISMMWVTQNMQILALSRGLYSGVIEFSDPTVKTSIKQVFSLKYDGAVPSWVSWNYKGYDVLTTWPGVKKFFDYLSTLPDGRVVHEFS